MVVELAQLDSLFFHINSKLPNINLEAGNSLTKEQLDLLLSINIENLTQALLEHSEYTEDHQLNKEGKKRLRQTLLIQQKLVEKLENAKNLLAQLTNAFEQNDEALVNELHRDFFNDYLTWFNLTCFDAGQLDVLNLIKANRLKPQEINDRVTVTHLKNRTDEPKELVVIGAGPTGLMAALKLYESGANITLLEARQGSQLHTRKQAVVLDPSIMADLRHYLGSDDYSGLFKRGYIYPDGRGHIIIKDLERALMSRLIELARVNSSDLKIVTGMKAYEIIPPDDHHKKFRVGVLEHDTSFDCDYVYCAEGGRNAFSNPLYLLKSPNKAEVNRDQTPNAYITMIYDIKENNPQNLFQVEGQLTHIKKIRDEFQPSLMQIEAFISGFLNSSYPLFTELRRRIDNDELAEPLNRAFNELLKAETFKIKVDEKEDNLRTFETKGQFYIATKVPPVLQTFMQLLNQIANDSKAKEKSKQLARDMQINIQLEWSKLLTHKFPFLSDPRVTLDYKNSQSFVVNPQGTAVAARILKHQEQELMVLAGGDLFRAPHFYSGSGLSSAHAEVNAFNQYFQWVKDNPDNQRQYQAYFLGEMQHIAHFVDKKMAEYCHLNRVLHSPVDITIEEVGTEAINMERMLQNIRSHRDYLREGLSSFRFVRTWFQGLRQEKLSILDSLVNKLEAQSCYHDCQTALKEVLTEDKVKILEQHRYSLWSSGKTRSADFVDHLKESLEVINESERFYFETPEIKI
ncbi:FAD-dependent oxidoreductase [Legionella bononiensis]|uniref:FAD-dependent monooxygenase n=1 Tax=Legionella bononiensis TaxID=2793102 RepID=A0ABS1W6S3_9GAMM|nr:FAD-dependent monooxygenase [Legionella bononiensis]MBL7525076.1 FAD-dependent monooxygenase [Legionella bononiensis]MBL7562801.1 FAD-dependent monooxygenase [Legionella bononiensis]